MRPELNAAGSRRGTVWGGLLIVAAVLAAYSNSFHGAFVFDDLRTIVENPTLQRWWVVTSNGSPASGRPLVHFSLALNRALGGLAVEGYHAFNLAVHLGAALVLFGLVRRSLRLPGAHSRFGRGGDAFAALAATVWAVHPLQTEAVTYVVQRAESLCGFFYLFTLYAFVRSVEPCSRRARLAWSAAAVLACFAGTGAKEVIVTVPVLVLLFDRTFVAGSFRGAWQARGWLHAAMFASWLPLAGLVAAARSRGGSAGFGGDLAWWQYGLKQAEAVFHYLRLSVWPHPLVFDYGTDVPSHLMRAIGPLAGIGALGSLALILLMRRPAAGFFAAGFLIMLAPSSSVVPVLTQTMAEHRMYLPLACVVVGGGLLLCGRFGRAGLGVLTVAALAGVGLTWQRNRVYATAESLWRDTAAHAPGNPRAWYNLGVAELAAHRPADAVESFRQAVTLRPAYAEAQDALGTALAEQGQLQTAITHLRTAVALQPAFAAAHLNLGSALQRAGETTAAITAYEAALRLDPQAVEAHFNLAGLCSAGGETQRALDHYEAALRLRPDLVDARFGRANTLARAGRLAEAQADYESLVRERPGDARAHTNLGHVYLLSGRVPAAIAAYEAALQIDPGDTVARAALEQARAVERGEGG